MAEDDFWEETDHVDYSKIKISDLLKKEKDKITYEYDFGDGWEHDIVLEKIFKSGANRVNPVCLTGRNNCPPEDCGGVWGFANLLEILKNPDHAEYEAYIEWLGEEYDPKYFDKNEINERLKSEDYGDYELF